MISCHAVFIHYQITCRLELELATGSKRLSAEIELRQSSSIPRSDVAGSQFVSFVAFLTGVLGNGLNQSNL